MRRRLSMRVRPRNFKETYINEALSWVGGSTYVEIGVRDGDSIREIRAARRIGIDPKRGQRLWKVLDRIEFFEKSSDAFFSEDARKVFAASRIDVALIDGLHEFEQALRDLLNLERYMRSNGVIVLDDVNPRASYLATDTPTGNAWNGDVWKVAVYLREERPDLYYCTVDADQGIGIVTGFAGTGRGWPRRSTIERIKGLGYDDLSSHRRTFLNLVPRAPIAQLLRGRHVVWPSGATSHPQE